MTGKEENIIKDDESECDGCGTALCLFREQALRVIDAPAEAGERLIEDFFCGNFGACLSGCLSAPPAAEEKKAGSFDGESLVEKILRIEGK